ncbi:prohibitin family protein [Anthocerotibacter panamensis]|uniref:prohibitin family protein n=1 Tax=Anthocerotibacter panamensis TaxID=2857077 RepID=UPI001C402CD8|nr:prohibitin family protein [Anthocerotibacter panamensis]
MSLNRIDVPKWLPQAVLAGGVVLILLSTNPFRFVENGQNLVVFSWFGGVQSTPLEPGFHIVVPVVSETIPFDIKTQALTWKDGDESAYGPRLIALSRDGQEIRTEVTLNYRVSDPPKVYSTLGTDYVDRVAPIVRSIIASETAGFSAQDLYSTKRPVLQAQTRERIAMDLQPYGITVTDFLLRDVAFEQEFVSAIEAKTIAENQLAKKSFEIDQARQEALSAISQAKGEAGRLEAKADALTKNPDYLKVVKSGVLGDTLDTLVTK